MKLKNEVFLVSSYLYSPTFKTMQRIVPFLRFDRLNNPISRQFLLLFLTSNDKILDRD